MDKNRRHTEASWRRAAARDRRAWRRRAVDPASRTATAELNFRLGRLSHQRFDFLSARGRELVACAMNGADLDAIRAQLFAHLANHDVQNFRAGFLIRPIGIEHGHHLILGHPMAPHQQPEQHALAVGQLSELDNFYACIRGERPAHGLERIAQGFDLAPERDQLAHRTRPSREMYLLAIRRTASRGSSSFGEGRAVVAAGGCLRARELLGGSFMVSPFSVSKRRIVCLYNKAEMLAASLGGCGQDAKTNRPRAALPVI